MLCVKIFTFNFVNCVRELVRVIKRFCRILKNRGYRSKCATLHLVTINFTPVSKLYTWTIVKPALRRLCFTLLSCGINTHC